METVLIRVETGREGKIVSLNSSKFKFDPDNLFYAKVSGKNAAPKAIELLKNIKFEPNDSEDYNTFGGEKDFRVEGVGFFRTCIKEAINHLEKDDSSPYPYEVKASEYGRWSFRVEIVNNKTNYNIKY